MKHKSKFGAALFERRTKLHLTQAFVAEQIGASTPYVGLLESGRRSPSIGCVLKLASALDMSPMYFAELAFPEYHRLFSPGKSVVPMIREQLRAAAEKLSDLALNLQGCR